ncbi:hypothetical protein [Nesterenkonia pannonica]|uniref:hypothetical protein n=1 Tax=Nesterenkonia pannonica TaxID=1548602 RepID=UPI002164738D|nr:hypothetical protein [Nesterenkonia pannonica]
MPSKSSKFATRRCPSARLCAPTSPSPTRLGTTTKINEPGPALVQDQVEALAQAVIRRAGTASWTALAGSLPPGVPETFYADVISRLRSAAHEAPHAIAVDASGPALAHAAAAYRTSSSPTLRSSSSSTAP